MGYLFQQGLFVIRFRWLLKIRRFFRNTWFSALGMKIGEGTFLPRLYVTWPHQVIIGKNCNIEHNVYFHFDGIWQKGGSINIGNNVFIGANCEFNIREGIDIGNDTLIASGCRFVDHDHGLNANNLIRKQEGVDKAIRVGADVWFGCNVVVLKGVEIGNGAVIAAGAVVTKSIPQFEIWGGVPAKKIGNRNSV